MKRKLICDTPIYVKEDEAPDFIKLCTNKTPSLEWENLMKKYGLFETYLNMDACHEHLVYDVLYLGEPDNRRVDMVIADLSDKYMDHLAIELLAIIIARFHTLIFDSVFLSLQCNPYPAKGVMDSSLDDIGYLISPGKVDILYKRWKEYDEPLKIEIQDVSSNG